MLLPRNTSTQQELISPASLYTEVSNKCVYTMRTFWLQNESALDKFSLRKNVIFPGNSIRLRYTLSPRQPPSQDAVNLKKFSVIHFVEGPDTL
jgi:hypothetical protein